MTESEMVGMCRAYIERCFPGTRVACEVPFLSRCIDMVLLTGTETVTIEFKLHDWRQAIKQARDHKLGANRAYVCMPYRKQSDAMIRALDKEGIGLLFYMDDGTMAEARPAVRNEGNHQVFTRLMHDAIKHMKEEYAGDIVQRQAHTRST